MLNSSFFSSILYIIPSLISLNIYGLCILTMATQYTAFISIMNNARHMTLDTTNDSIDIMDQRSCLFTIAVYMYYYYPSFILWFVISYACTIWHVVMSQCAELYPGVVSISRSLFHVMSCYIMSSLLLRINI